MIFQTDTKLPKAVNLWGCYFMSCIYIASAKNKKTFDVAEIEAIYKACIQTGILSKEVYKDGVLVDGCTVQDPISLFHILGVSVGTVVKTDANYKPGSTEHEIRHYHRDADTPKGMANKPHDHFVAVINGKIVDPIENSNTVKYGYLKSKRIFK